MKNLNELWILTKAGAVIFNKSREDQIDEQFFGMLLSVLNTYAEQLSSGGLSSFELGNRRFCMVEQNNFIFIASCSTKTKDKNAKKDLQGIINLFFKQYPENIANTWNGDLKAFSDFGDEMEKKYK